MRLTVGQTIGRYVIESLLGEGGMGEVYRARDTKLERSVALKVLRNETEGSSEEWEHAVMRMQREAQAVAALSHPGIVAIYDISEHDGAPFIAMELVGGQPLRDLIGQESPFGTRLRILLDVAKALGAAHEAGFVHRDIKPENILVRPDGVAKILDFGIARKTSRSVDHSVQTLDLQGATVDAALVSMTLEGTLVGTPAYMSPEQLRGETADARSDQFAWGVVAYELFRGTHPFHAEKGTIGLLAAVLGETPLPLENIPEGIASAVMRALEKDAQQRWPSMQDLVTHCEAFITGAASPKAPKEQEPERNVSTGQTQQHTTTRVSRARWLIAPITAAAILSAVVAFGFRGRAAPATIAPVAVPVATPQATATTVTDLPIPASTNATAIAEFRQGLQNIRDARWTAAAVSFNHARAADPGMAAAHFRFSLIQFSFDITSARDAYRKALALRASLTERDQAFLHALEPMMLREPCDYVEAAKRMEALAARYPLDAELTFWHARMVIHIGSGPEYWQRVVDLNDHCVKIDPQYGDCWQTKASALRMMGKHEEAATTLQECIKVSESGVDCLLDKIEVESLLGHCTDVISLTQNLQTKDPLALHASTLLAQSLYFKGEPPVVVRAAFDQAERRAKELGRLFDASSIALVRMTNEGDFAAAIEQANVMTRTMTSPNLEKEIALYALRAALYVEIGKPLDAARVADEFLIAQALRSATSTKIAIDPTMFMHTLRLRAGKLTASEYEKARAAWLESRPKATHFNRALNWLSGYAAPAHSAELAKEALERMPDDVREVPLDGARYVKPFATYRGRLLVLTGKYEEAIPHLENAVRICTNDQTALWYVQDNAFLGIAREATGDKPGACQAYERVLSRWGKSKQSLTVKDVAKRAQKLGCAISANQ